MTQQTHKTSDISLFTCLVMASVLCGTTILGLITGAAFSPFIKDRFLTPWYSLGSPPEPAEKILAVARFSIEVISSNGDKYIFQPDNFRSDELQGNWTLDESFLKKDLHEPVCAFNQLYASLPGSAKAKDYSALAWCPEIVVDIQYAILEDGSVWRWNSTTHPSSLIPSSWFVGAGIGFVVGMVIVIGKLIFLRSRPDL